MARFATGDLVALKPEKLHETVIALDLAIGVSVCLPAGLPLLVMAIKPEGSGWNSVFVNRNYRPRYRAKVMDPSTGKLYATTIKSLTKICKE